ncbi:unnamed protein product [Orchesella dallaii]|uniref:MYND-type domain-containing protein n=1 Tax=Orchesella dallaii TaxID=48710 RepID=A0ABP1Q947_9HEXA
MADSDSEGTGGRANLNQGLSNLSLQNLDGNDTDDVERESDLIVQREEGLGGPRSSSDNNALHSQSAAAEVRVEAVNDSLIDIEIEHVDEDSFVSPFAHQGRLTSRPPPANLVEPLPNDGDNTNSSNRLRVNGNRLHFDNSSSDDDVLDVDDSRYIGSEYVTLSSDSDSDHDSFESPLTRKLIIALRERKQRDLLESGSQEPGPSSTSTSTLPMNPDSDLYLYRYKDKCLPIKKMKMESDTKKLQRPSYLDLCQKCSQPGNYVCKGCLRVAYCCEEHQHDDWDSHRSSCLHFGLELSPYALYRGPFRIYPENGKSCTSIGSSQKYTMKAKTTIPEKNQTILEEKPFLVCPWPRNKIRQTEQGPTKGLVIRNLSCFGCGKVTGFSSVRCTECDLFLCSDNCPYLECHRDYECKLIQQQIETGKTAKSNDPRLNLMNMFTNDEYREWIYIDVMILRLLKKLSDMQNSMSPEKFQYEWAALNIVWKGCCDMIGTTRRALVSTNLTSFLKFSFKATDGNFDLVWKLFCIVDTNSFVFELPFQRFNVLCTVLGTASHSCIPNSVAFLKQSDMENIDVNQPETHPHDLTIILKSGQPIASGEAITFPYVPLILGTEDRRNALYNKYLFFCTCARCMDPTELGIYTTHVRCLACSNGVLIPTKESVSVMSMDAYTQKRSNWECRLPNSSGKVGCRRPSPIIAHLDLVDKLKTMEANTLRYLVNPTKVKAYLSLRPDNMTCFNSVMLKVCEDILRGTYYPLPDVLADDLKDFSDDALLCIVLARNIYRDFMKKIYPGFNFEG